MTSSSALSPDEITLKLQEAIELHRAMSLTKAKQIYEDVLRFEPSHFDALQLLGVVYGQQKE